LSPLGPSNAKRRKHGVDADRPAHASFAAFGRVQLAVELAGNRDRIAIAETADFVAGRPKTKARQKREASLLPSRMVAMR
jgi:hypothetical protein